MQGLDTGDLRCTKCGRVDSPAALEAANLAQTCKNPGCGSTFTKKEEHVVTLAKGYVENLKQGRIRCPACGALHVAGGVHISQPGPGLGTYQGGFGELAQDGVR
jgi:hypothetical protein